VKISGTVLSSKNYNPIALAKIRLDVQDKETGTILFTDEHGFYEFKSDQDYIGQTLTYTIEKDGFEEKTFSTVIDKAEIKKKFLLRETEALKDKFATLKGFVYAIIIVITMIAILIASLIGSTPTPVEGYEINKTVGLNDMYSINMTIDKKWDWMPFVNPGWELQSKEQWIKFNKLEGQKNDTVQIILFTPDFQFSPGKSDVNFSLIDTKLDFIESDTLKLIGKPMTLHLNITEEKKKPELNITVKRTREEPPEFRISIKNVGDGAPWWTLRSDKIWIELWNNIESKDKYNSNNRRFDDGDVYFTINMSNIEEENKTVEGNITLGYNNDGKDKIHIFVCKNASPPVNWTIESWYLPDYYNESINESGIKPPRPNICTE